MMDFATAYSNLQIGDTVAVSLPGFARPTDETGIDFRAWWSNNFTGQLAEIGDDYLRFDLPPNEDGSVIGFQIRAGAHVFAPIEWNEPLWLAKERRWIEIKTQRDVVMYGGCDTPLGPMDTDPMSQAKVTGAATMAQLIGASFTVDWTMRDNSVATHNFEQMKAAALAVGHFVAECHAIGQARRAAIEAATTVAEVEAIQWS